MTMTTTGIWTTTLTLALLMPSALAAPPTVAAPQDATRIEAPVTSVALFKNGLAVLQRRIDLPTAGAFELQSSLDPVHGTLWIDADPRLETRLVRREVEVASDGRWDLDPARELAGCDVRIRLRGEPLTEVMGRVPSLVTPPKEATWNRDYEQRWRYGGQQWQPQQGNQRQPSPFLALDTERGRTFIDRGTIAFLEVKGLPLTKRVERSLLQFQAPAATNGTFSYLAKGLSYAPSYHLDIRDPKTLTIAQTAVLRNELETLKDVEFELISGFPSMEYSHVLSPLSDATTWADFFTQLGQEFDQSRGGRMAMSQSAASNFANYSASSGGGAIQPGSEGVDLHYHSIGIRDLALGEALFVHVASANAAYERIVEWRIPDTRDEWGRPSQRQSWEPKENDEADGAWDALRFSNPFDFPMTTAPATIVNGPRFQGQRTTSWVNPGEETSVRITKALAIRTTIAEYEEESAREDVFRWGSRFRQTGARGEIQLCNHRKEPVTIVIRREFSGDFVSATDEPTTKLLERGVYSINRRQELIWTLTLTPGEERRLEYAYEVLTRI